MPHRPDDAPAVLRELRLLDDPNLYFARAACKVVLDLHELLELSQEAFVERTRQWGTVGTAGGPGTEVRARTLARLLVGLTRRLAATAGVVRLAVPTGAGAGPRGRPGPHP